MNTKDKKIAVLHTLSQEHKPRLLEEYISSQTSEWVKKEDQASFIGDVMEDLKELDSNRIEGLGITQEQLSEFLRMKL